MKTRVQFPYRPNLKRKGVKNKMDKINTILKLDGGLFQASYYKSDNIFKCVLTCRFGELNCRLTNLDDCIKTLSDRYYLLEVGEKPNETNT